MPRKRDDYQTRQMQTAIRAIEHAMGYLAEYCREDQRWDDEDDSEPRMTRQAQEAHNKLAHARERLRDAL